MSPSQAVKQDVVTRVKLTLYELQIGKKEGPEQVWVTLVMMLPPFPNCNIVILTFAREVVFNVVGAVYNSGNVV